MDSVGFSDKVSSLFSSSPSDDKPRQLYYSRSNGLTVDLFCSIVQDALPEGTTCKCHEDPVARLRWEFDCTKPSGEDGLEPATANGSFTQAGPGGQVEIDFLETCATACPIFHATDYSDCHRLCVKDKFDNVLGPASTASSCSASVSGTECQVCNVASCYSYKEHKTVVAHDLDCSNVYAGEDNLRLCGDILEHRDPSPPPPPIGPHKGGPGVTDVFATLMLVMLCSACMCCSVYSCMVRARQAVERASSEHQYLAVPDNKSMNKRTDVSTKAASKDYGSMTMP